MANAILIADGKGILNIEEKDLEEYNTYLWQGLKQLDGATLAAIRARAEAYLGAAHKAEAAGQRPRLLCPLNEGGLCRLYRHRLLICRSHGVPATLVKLMLFKRNCDRDRKSVV